MIKRIYFVLMIVVMAISSPSHVYASTDFISVLPDVPLAPCFIEEQESAVTFDKPDGRYVEVSAICRSSSISERDLVDFYTSSLPQLGWKLAPDKGGEKYVKNKDVLTIEYESDSSFSRIKVTVQPQPQNLG